MLKLISSPETDERTLVQQAILGDKSAYGALYDLHVTRVYRHIYYMVGNAAEAEDLTAQAFLQGWEAIARYQMRGAPFVSWLLRIAHNLGVSFLRSRKEASQLPETLVDHGSDGNPERATQLRLEGERVRDAIMKLREEQRKVIILRFVEDLEYKEVAVILGKSVAAVRVIQHRALNALRKQVALDEAAGTQVHG